MGARLLPERYMEEFAAALDIGTLAFDIGFAVFDG
jgi:hypothetical protein